MSKTTKDDGVVDITWVIPTIILLLLFGPSVLRLLVMIIAWGWGQ